MVFNNGLFHVLRQIEVLRNHQPVQWVTKSISFEVTIRGYLDMIIEVNVI